MPDPGKVDVEATRETIIVLQRALGFHEDEVRGHESSIKAIRTHIEYLERQIREAK